MKTRFNTFDIVCSVAELQNVIGMRVNQVYDIDNKTYLIKLHRGEEKCVLLLESGNRFHLTNFEWPKNMAPSGFSMKMRKHLKNKRLEHLNQLGTDRIVDLQFGSGEAAYHVILELYDRGNVVLTDHELTILYVLRPHTEGDKVKFAVREKYPQDRARECAPPSTEELKNILTNAKPGTPLRKVLVPFLEYGPPLIEHVLLKNGFANSIKIGKDFDIDSNLEQLSKALQEADDIMKNAMKNSIKGYIIQKKEERPSQDETKQIEYFYSNQEFHPYLYQQHESQPYQELPTFNQAVDEFFSSLEGQKLELKALQQEKEALKKLENVKKDHTQRLIDLEKTQETDKQRAELITRNSDVVDNAILAIQSALANQTSWDDIENLVKEAQARGDPIAKVIKKLKLETNHISLYLTDPYEEDSTDLPPMTVDIDLALTAFANARRYYDQKRSAAKKQQKTIESQGKALKSAEKKTKQTLKEVQTITNINKARKVYWFEKFFWFISSENYLVIAGRDQQQNELIVKRYMKPQDIYVHADIHGASSVIIKNPTGQPVPPKTLNEAGTMAICYSVAWDAKVVTNAYWVLGEQVSKTAPTGEYLSTGSFMIRGKKNFLPPSHLILGMSFLFRLEDGCIEKHKGERRVITMAEEDAQSIADSEASKDEVEVEVIDESDEDELNEKEENDNDKKQNEDDNKKDNLEQDGKENVSEKGEIEGEGDAEASSESSSEEEESGPKFPDTHIKIQHFQGTKINIIAEPVMKMQTKENDEEAVVYLGDNQPVVLKPNQNQRSRANSENKNKQQKSVSNNNNKQQNNVKEENIKQQTQKRGQKSKLKKIKEKYRDQDDEERKLRMDILQSAGNGGGKDSKKNKKSKDSNQKGNTGKTIKTPRVPQQRPENEGEGDEEEPAVNADVDMIDALTGIPTTEDELLFAVPVIAPYNTLSSYKFKVKLTPGTSKRGKASKTAVSMFIHDRNTTQREKDLLKAVKDEQMARNLPGKVKLSAPRLQIHKK